MTEQVFTTLTPAETAEAEKAAATNAAVFDFKKAVLRKPTNGAEAKNRLDALSKDDAWQKRLFAGDGAAHREFQALTEMMASDGAAFDPTAPDAREHLPLIETVADGDMTKGEQVRHVEGLREHYGLNDIQLREMMTGIDSNTGKPFTPENAAAAASALARDTSDPVFAQRAATRGTPEAARTLLLNGIIAAGSVVG